MGAEIKVIHPRKEGWEEQPFHKVNAASHRVPATSSFTAWSSFTQSPQAFEALSSAFDFPQMI